MSFPNFVKKYFWEINTDELDTKENARYVIRRVLEYGDIDAARWMFKTFDSKIIRDALSKDRDLSRPTGNFWRLFFDLKQEDITCLKKPYPKNQKTHWPY
jgi:hypothetical protein